MVPPPLHSRHSGIIPPSQVYSGFERGLLLVSPLFEIAPINLLAASKIVGRLLILTISCRCSVDVPPGTKSAPLLGSQSIDFLRRLVPHTESLGCGVPIAVKIYQSFDYTAVIFHHFPFAALLAV
jgi:hypothetical protein